MNEKKQLFIAISTVAVITLTIISIKANLSHQAEVRLGNNNYQSGSLSPQEYFCRTLKTTLQQRCNKKEGVLTIPTHTGLPLSGLTLHSIFGFSGSKDRFATPKLFIIIPKNSIAKNSQLGAALLPHVRAFTSTGFYLHQPVTLSRNIDQRIDVNNTINSKQILIVPGMIISPFYLEYVGKEFELPYYQTHFVPSQLASEEPTRTSDYLNNEELVLIPQFIQADMNEKLTLLKKYPGLRTLRYETTGAKKQKIRRNNTLQEYTHITDNNPVKLKDLQKIHMATPSNIRDVDSIRSMPYLNTIADSACTKTKRLNGEQFGLPIPYGFSPYETLGAVRTGPEYLGESKEKTGTLQEFLANKQPPRRTLLDPSNFPTGTNIVEIIYHSDSTAGSKFGHANLGFVYGGKLFLLDPYVDVPGYDKLSPKLIDDFIKSRRVVGHIAPAKVYYRKSSLQRK